MPDAKQRIKDQIMQVLKQRGQQTATELAEALGVSPMAVRQHLQHLQADQWVVYREEKRALGRPVKLWHLTARSHHRFPDSHADLMLDLLRSVETVFGDAGLDRLVAERSRRQIQAYQTQLSGQTDWLDRVQAIAQLRSQEGYMAEVIRQSDSVLLVENHCPICTAATACQKLCGAELAVFQQVLGSTVAVERVEHILQGDRRCAYRVSPHPG